MIINTLQHNRVIHASFALLDIRKRAIMATPIRFGSVKIAHASVGAGRRPRSRIKARGTNIQQRDRAQPGLLDCTRNQRKKKQNSPHIYVCMCVCVCFGLRDQDGITVECWRT